MRVLLQRVKQAAVTVSGQEVGKIKHGLCLFVGFTHGDDEAALDYAVKKITGLRIFEDDAQKMNLALADVGGEILSISQFTLYGYVKKGRRPSFSKSLPGEQAKALYEQFNAKLQDTGTVVQTGLFGADMDISILNHGPVTFMIDTNEM